MKRMPVLLVLVTLLVLVLAVPAAAATGSDGLKAAAALPGIRVMGMGVVPLEGGGTVSVTVSAQSRSLVYSDDPEFHMSGPGAGFVVVVARAKGNRPVVFTAPVTQMSTMWEIYRGVSLTYRYRGADYYMYVTEESNGHQGVWMADLPVLGVGTAGGPSPLLSGFFRLSYSLQNEPEVTVTSNADDGAGSLREAFARVSAGGTIHFASSLAGQTITLVSGPLIPKKNMTIDAAGAPGLTVSGNQADRVLVVNSGVTVTVKSIALTNGYGWQIGGGIVNNGVLNLDHVRVSGCSVGTDTNDWWQGGAGIYNGSGAVLSLVDSTVSGNQAVPSGGAVYSSYNTNVTIARSTLSGNTSCQTGGAIRSLGNVTITDSTISGNAATGWHGGAIFHTDGAMDIKHCTITDNIAPDWSSSAIFIGQYGGPVPSLTITNSIVAGNRWYAFERFASGGTVNLISGGHNLFQDSSGSSVPSDLIGVNPLLGPLADNGGVTLTQALLPGSPAIDAADDGLATASDQRGVARPQGLHADIGAYEAP